ncbi:hypothetical protein F5X99DRAFT_404574 [Biscogniauxia marginata]|nr:hypothetical protein F5X99DRAFT_404574 [Biscogniauxia marginata]
MASLPGHSHIGLRRHCGICGHLMAINERFIACEFPRMQIRFIMIGSENSTECLRRTDISVFPDYGHSIRRLNDMLLCRRPGCKHCAASAEAVTVHSDCFDLYARNSRSKDALRRLWAFAAWRIPWREAPSILCDDEFPVAPNPLVLEGYALSELRKLSPEIIKTIQGFSATSLLWRFSSALELARFSSVAAPSELISIPLCQLPVWERGGVPIRATSRQAPFMRLTIDSRGIKTVERLPEMPRFELWRSDRLAFVIIEESCVKDFGMLRLELPKTLSGLQTWDTPTPPDQVHTTLYRADIGNSTQFRTIKLCDATGITFFFCHGNVYAIHAHTASAPSAKRTFESLSRRRQHTVTWLYVPIPPNDRITAFGTRLSKSRNQYADGLCFLFRMRLAGDIVAGPYAGDFGHFGLTTAPVALIYDTADLGPVSVIGACSKELRRKMDIVPCPQPRPKDVPLQNAIFSSGSLNNVVRIQTFHAEDNEACRGILLEYQNGAQRPLGQCRIHVDVTKEYATPAYICFLRMTSLRPQTSASLRGVKVECAKNDEHHHAEEGWTCCTMDGELDFWFNSEESDMMAIIHE